MKTLYIDCFSGISGDMFIGALLDAGADPSVLKNEIMKLGLEDDYQLVWKKMNKNGITCTKFDVLLSENDHHHHHHKHDHHHHHRSYYDIVKMIESSELADEVKTTSIKIFQKIGEAEGSIHGVPLEKVHFHEVGAVDSIIDIVGAAILLHQLEIKSIQASPIPVGSGKIHIEHGIYPVPAPATLEILKGLPIEQSDVKFELTTPTGAAIVAVLAKEFGTIPSIKVKAIGYGAGTKTFKERPNVLRVIIGE
jgi:pyridinium-3,5-bisthiocarboxylic acid mononucleotide nickel chelatase